MTPPDLEFARTFLAWLDTSPTLYEANPGEMPVYVKEVYAFWQETVRSWLMAGSYDPALVWARYAEVGPGWLDSATFDEARSAVRACVRVERFCSFGFAAMIEDGWLQPALRRILALTTQTGIMS